VVPERRFPAGLIANAAHAIDDREVVPVTRMNSQPFRILPAGRLASDLLLVTHPEWISGVQSDDAMVLDINARHAVTGRGQQEALIESDLQRAGFDLPVPVHLVAAKPKVPF